MMASKLQIVLPEVGRAMRSLAHNSLREENGPSLQQFRILELTHKGLSQTQMAHFLQVSMAAVSKLVDSLVKHGFLERIQCEDRRCLQLKLTPEGKRIYKKVTSQIEKSIDKHVVKLTKEEVSDLEKGLAVLDKIMGMINEK